jgi:hypothetical protein
MRKFKNYMICVGMVILIPMFTLFLVMEDRYCAKEKNTYQEEQVEEHQEKTQAEEPKETPTEQSTEKEIKPQEEIHTGPPPEILPQNLDIPLSDELQKFIYKECGYDDDFYCLVIAIIEQESNYDPMAVSVTEDYGLMQINESVHGYFEEKYGEKDFTNPYDNTYCGIEIIREYLEKYEYKNLALMAYNMGEPCAKRLWRDEVYSTSYSQGVLERYEKFSKKSEREM